MGKAGGESRLILAVSRRIRRFELRIEPDDWHALIDADWEDALVLIECGNVEIHCTVSQPWLVRQGAVLCLAGIGARALHNPGCETTVVAGYARNPAHARPYM